MAATSALDNLTGERVVSETAAEVADAVASWIAAQALRAYGDHGSFSIALSGGSTPRLLNQMLAGPDWRDRIDWSCWNVYFADERACAPDDPASNYHFAETTLAEPRADRPRTGAPHARGACRSRRRGGGVLGSARELTAFRKRRRTAARRDPPRAGRERPHRVAVSGHAGAEVTDRWATRGLADYAPFDRITLTYPAINAAAAVGFMVTGAAKHAALAATARGEVPASRVRPTDGTLAWFLDAAAAAG